jgi:UDP-4-amino-4,6-dideoxy-N-acetyl-beta-L-altrosamine N-acetyltransferase
MTSLHVMVLLRAVQIEDEEKILTWRNSSEVAPFMYRDDPISPVEHSRWIQSIISDTESSVVRVLEHNSVASGLSSLSKIDLRHKSCEWGGYLAPDIDRGGGIGRAMLFLALQQAFEEFELNRVVVEVLVGNHMALKLYESIGFVREGYLRERAWHASGPIDVLSLSMLRKDWKNIKEKTQLDLVKRGLVN